MNMLRHVLGVFGMTSTVVRHEDYVDRRVRRGRPRDRRARPGRPARRRPPQDRCRSARAVDDLLAAGQPFLAVCLGHQTLCQRLGIPLAYKDIVFQGTQSPVAIDGRTERVGFYNTFVGRVGDATRCPTASRVETDEATGDVHAVRGPHYRGIQFHAESILTENGYDLLHDRGARPAARRRLTAAGPVAAVREVRTVEPCNQTARRDVIICETTGGWETRAASSTRPGCPLPRALPAGARCARGQRVGRRRSAP